MWPQALNREAQPIAVVHYHVPINGAFAQPFCSSTQICRDGAKQRPRVIFAMACRVKEIFQKLNRQRVHGDVSDFSSFAVNTKMFKAPSFGIIFNAKGAELRAANGVKQKNRQDSAIALPL